MSALERVAPYAKAVVAFVTPGVVAIGTALTDASPGGTNITAGEWVGALVASLATATVVFSVPNAEADPAAPNLRAVDYDARHGED